MNKLLSNINVYEDPQWGASIKLQDWEHLDYIRDLYAEVFGIDYDFHIEDQNKNEYILHFHFKFKFKKIQDISEKINKYHLKTGEIFETL